jgi:hypothetical protein
MLASRIIQTALLTAAAYGASACGPTSDCKCGGGEVNASIWGTAEGDLLVAGYTGLDRGLLKTSSDGGFTVSEFFEQPLWRVWGTSVSDYWLVGGSTGRATVVHRSDGPVQIWGETSNGAPIESATGIWGSANDSVFVVGTGGAIAHFDGSNWNAQVSPVKEDLRDVWGSADNDVFAVGKGSSLLHYDGETWGLLPPPSGLPADANLNAVWGSGPDDVFVVGETEVEQAHVILHYDGSSFSIVREGKRSLLGVHGTGPNRVVAVGGQRVGSGVEAEVLTFDGVEWTEARSSAETFLWDVWVDDPGYTVVGPENTLLRQAL